MSEVSLNEINDIIVTIQDEIYEQVEPDNTYISYTSNGEIIIIEFLGIQIWNSDDDEREYIEVSGLEEYEPLERYLRKVIIKLINTLSKVKL